MGGRNAGSDAEHRTADYLVEKMNEIGLDDVKKQAAKCDKWQFNSASFVVDEKNILSTLMQQQRQMKMG